jgi:uncharacterized tellurite resistance protein B-like protein
MGGAAERDMLDQLRDFISRLRKGSAGHHVDADDTRLALAALLVHCMAIDGTVSDRERGALRALLTVKFGLSGADLETLLDDAIAAEREAVDLYRFTSVLKRQLNEEERIRVIDHLWEVVFADGKSHEFEENLVWRIAELLGVQRRDRIASKLAVAENKSSDQQDAG